jgi:hypothetical protein
VREDLRRALISLEGIGDTYRRTDEFQLMRGTDL